MLSSWHAYEPEERTRYLERTLERTQFYTRSENIKLQTYLGNAYKSEGKIRQAIEQYKQVIKAVGEDIPELAAAYIGLGSCHSIESEAHYDLNRASMYFLTGACIAQRIKNPRIACIGYVNLGDTYWKRAHAQLQIMSSGDWENQGYESQLHVGQNLEKAVQYCELALWMMDGVGDLRVFLRLLHVLGNVYQHQGQIGIAEKCSNLYQQWLERILQNKESSKTKQYESEMLEIYRYQD